MVGYKPVLIFLGAAVAGSVLMAGSRLTKPTIPNQKQADGSVVLPNGWRVTPAGKAISLAGDFPLKMGLSEDGSKLVVCTGGFHDQGVTIIDTATNIASPLMNLGDAWAGLAIRGDHAYVSGGPLPIRTITLSQELVRDKDIRPFEEVKKSSNKKKRTGAQFIAGLAIAGGNLFAVNTSSDAVIKLEGDPFRPSAETKVGYRPYGIAVSPDQRQLAISNWGDQSVSIIDCATMKEVQRIGAGSHPNDILWAQDGRIFVANAGSNDITVIQNGKAVETVKTSLSPRDLVGSTPIALALAPDGKTLYVANADNNDVAVLDVSHETSVVRGFIPTGWYPSSLALSKDGKKLYIGTGKGLKFDANFPPKTTSTRTNYDDKFKFDYIGGVLSGHVNVVDVPSADQLHQYSMQVAANFPSPRDGGISSRQADSITKNALKKIKHVVYVIRENRSYDQVFGDLPKGNNDPNLVLFGKTVTPNAHALAQSFVQLDNLYCNGEVSEDGHQWCDSAYCTDFTEKAWVNSYAGRGEPDADDRLTASPAGYFWDNCRLHGVSFYSYGEGSSFTSTPNSPPKFNGNKGLEGHGSLAWSRIQKGDDFGRDYQKVEVFINDLKKAEATGNWPGFMVMSLGEDHTKGLKSGSFTPQAAVASNDYGLAKMIDSVSHSQFWKDTAFFIIEDDAQNGPDHVDAHRTVGLVISPYVKRGFLDSTQYTTASFVRTMELILGLPPMTQFDQKATPLFASFTTKPDFTPVEALKPEISLETKNAKKTTLALESGKLDWSSYDRADPDKLNSILWRALKPGRPMPPPTRSAHIIR